MKIGIISNMYPSDNDSRYGIFVKGITESLIKKGVEVPFLCVIKGRERNKFKKIIKYLKLYFFTVFYLLFKKTDAVYFHYPLHLAPLLYLLSFFMIKPAVLNFHGTDLQNNNSGILLVFDRLLKRAVKCARLIVVPSRHLQQVVCKKFDVGEEMVFISPSGGVDFTLFKMADDNPANIKEYTAGFVSRISESKGWKVYLNAISILKRKGAVTTQKFLLAGTGPDDDCVQKTVNDLELSDCIDFVKTGEQSKFPFFFNSIDVLIFPSFSESLGLVGLESMACGTPVIGSRIGGIAQYLTEDQNGFFFEAGDAQDLAEKIEKWMRLSKVEKMRFRENALNTAKDYDRDRIAAILYKKLIWSLTMQEM